MKNKATRIKLAEILDDVLALARIADEKAYKDLSFLKERKFHELTMTRVLSHYKLFKSMCPSVRRNELREDYYLWEKIASNRVNSNSHFKAIIPDAPSTIANLLTKVITPKEDRLFPLGYWKYWDYINSKRHQ